MSARRVDAGIPFRPRKRAFEEPYKAPQRLMEPKLAPPPELMDHRTRHKPLKCPNCGRIRAYNARIDAVVCNICNLVWYRGKKYNMKDWEEKWLVKLDRSKRSL